MIPLVTAGQPFGVPGHCIHVQCRGRRDGRPVRDLRQLSRAAQLGGIAVALDSAPIRPP